jgi:hypothetical protein
MSIILLLQTTDDKLSRTYLDYHNPACVIRRATHPPTAPTLSLSCVRARV